MSVPSMIFLLHKAPGRTSFSWSSFPYWNPYLKALMPVPIVVTSTAEADKIKTRSRLVTWCIIALDTNQAGPSHLSLKMAPLKRAPVKNSPPPESRTEKGPTTDENNYRNRLPLIWLIRNGRGGLTHCQHTPLVPHKFEKWKGEQRFVCVGLYDGPTESHVYLEV